MTVWHSAGDYVGGGLPGEPRARKRVARLRVDAAPGLPCTRTRVYKKGIPSRLGSLGSLGSLGGCGALPLHVEVNN